MTTVTTYTPRRCQGCGLVEGEYRQTVIRPKEGGYRVKTDKTPTSLTLVPLLDYGERLLCRACEKLAFKQAARILGDGRAVVGFTKPQNPVEFRLDEEAVG